MKNFIKTVLILFTIQAVLLNNFISIESEASDKINALSWTEIKCPVMAGEFTGICYGNGKYVAVGLNGLAAVSEDGVKWIKAQDTKQNLLSVCCNNGVFTALGRGCTAASSDGISWKINNSEGLYGFYDESSSIVAVNKKIFVSSGNEGLKTSEDGQHWVTVSKSYYFNKMLYNQKMIMAEGYITKSGGSMASGIFSSKEGVSWKFVSEGDCLEVINGQFYFQNKNTIYSIAGTGTVKKYMTGIPGSIDNNYVKIYGFSKSNVIGGYLSHLASFNGRKWSLPLISCDPGDYKIMYVNNRFFIVGNDTLITSSDSMNWVSAFSACGYVNSIAKGNNTYVVVGKNGFIMKSSDAKNWKRVKSATPYSLNSVVWDGKRFTAVGERGTILTSVDGDKWTIVKSSVSDELYRVKYGNGKIVASGSKLLESIDGRTWKTTASLDCPSAALEFGGGRFICLSGNKCLTSKDGIKWIKSGSNYSAKATAGNKDGGYERLRTGSVECYDILWANNQFIFFWGFYNHWPDVSDSIFLTSSDGISWNMKRQNELDGEVFAITYGDGRYVAAGTGVKADGFIGVSLEDMKWSSINPVRRWFTDILFDNDNKRFIAICNNYWDNEFGIVWVSN